MKDIDKRTILILNKSDSITDTFIYPYYIILPKKGLFILQGPDKLYI